MSDPQVDGQVHGQFDAQVAAQIDAQVDGQVDSQVDLPSESGEEDDGAASNPASDANDVWIQMLPTIFRFLSNKDVHRLLTVDRNTFDAAVHEVYRCTTLEGFTKAMGCWFTLKSRRDKYLSAVRTLDLTGQFPLLNTSVDFEHFFEVMPSLKSIVWCDDYITRLELDTEALTPFSAVLTRAVHAIEAEPGQAAIWQLGASHVPPSPLRYTVSEIIRFPGQLPVDEVLDAILQGPRPAKELALVTDLLGETLRLAAAYGRARAAGVVKLPEELSISAACLYGDDITHLLDLGDDIRLNLYLGEGPFGPTDESIVAKVLHRGTPRPLLRRVHIVCPFEPYWEAPSRLISDLQIDSPLATGDWESNTSTEEVAIIIRPGSWGFLGEDPDSVFFHIEKQIESMVDNLLIIGGPYAYYDMSIVVPPEAEDMVADKFKDSGRTLRRAIERRIEELRRPRGWRQLAKK